MNILNNNIYGQVSTIEEQFETFKRQKTFYKGLKLNDDDKISIDFLKNDKHIEDAIIIKKNKDYEFIRIFSNYNYTSITGYFKKENEQIYFIINDKSSFCFHKKNCKMNSIIKYNNQMIWFTHEEINNTDVLILNSDNVNFPNDQVTIRILKYFDFITVTKKYYDTNYELYNKFFELDIIKSNRHQKFKTHTLENHIKYFYKNRTNKFNYSYLIQNKIIEAHNFEKQTIHSKININFDFKSNKLLGIFIDLSIKFLISNNNKYSPIAFFKTCNFYSTLPQNILNIDNDYELINYILTPKFKTNVMIFNDKFNNIRNGELIFNHELKSYGLPDLLSNTFMIDIKTGKKNNISSKNYLQLLYYAILHKKRKICIYEPVNGNIYTMILNIENCKKFYNYIKELVNTTINNDCIPHLKYFNF